VSAALSPEARQIRGVILDFGGVMTEPVFRRPRDLAPELIELGVFFLREAAEVYHHLEATHDLHLLETGKMSEATFFVRLCDRYAAAGYPRVDPAVARAAIVGRGIVACGAMVDAAREIHDAGYRTALLTNNAREWESQWRSLIPVDELFDVVVDSSAVGLRKPDPAIYRLTCDRMGIMPPQCVFVDDMACNVDTARELGMEAVLCDDAVAVAAALRRRLLPARSSDS
jgi:putative hydrolase of the HAD superfamily